MEKCTNICVFSKGCRDSASYVREVEVLDGHQRFEIVGEIGKFLAGFFNLSYNPSVADAFIRQLIASQGSLEYNIHNHQRETGCRICFNNLEKFVS